LSYSNKSPNGFASFNLFIASANRGAIETTFILSILFSGSIGIVFVTTNSFIGDFSILSINPNNINDWQAVYTSNLFYGTSAAIVTDGTYVYGVSYTTPAKFFKIRISDWTLVSSQVWDNGHSGHGASLIQYPDKSELYFSASYYGGAFAKVNPLDLSYTDVVGFGNLITDDMYCRKISDEGATCYTASEDNSINHLFAIDTKTMTVKTITSLASYGVFSDGSSLFNLAKTGYITKYPNFDLSSPQIFSLPNEIPNSCDISSYEYSLK
jgi:hypothetical protein